MSHVLVYLIALSTLVYLLRHLYKLSTRLNFHTDPIAQRTSQMLPVETIERIADFLFEARPPIMNRDSATPISCVKPQWNEVAGFMEASPALHAVGYVRWLTVLTVQKPEDWAIVSCSSQLVRELRCADGALINARHQNILGKFSHLYALSIDAHGDVMYDNRNHFTYRDLFLSLPTSLRRLEIIRAHGPDMKVISAAKEYCPNLEELRLGRCTVFNSPTICKFWQTFPLDHDSYMSIEDTDSYVHSVAQELGPLQSLQRLRLGLYLIPSTTILAHRVYHKRNMVAPEVIEWQHAVSLAVFPNEAALNDVAALNLLPGTTDQLSSILYQTDPYEDFGSEQMCELCVESISQTGYESETRANAILKNLLPNLKSVEWMSWLSSGHTGVNIHEL
ncbi:hypothetical protein FRC12_004289 [Ceratobasidium sp. 428]|nr:hypothetical protein FRC12_004289 [Ceratobasidium sp. 428]